MNKLEIINSEIEKVNERIESYERDMFLVETGVKEFEDLPRIKQWWDKDKLQKAKLEGIRDNMMAEIEKAQGNAKARQVNKMADSVMRPDKFPIGTYIIDLKEDMDMDLEKEMNNLFDITGRNQASVMEEMGTDKFSVEIRLPFVFDKSKSFQDNMVANSELFHKLREVDKKFQPARDLKELGK